MKTFLLIAATFVCATVFAQKSTTSFKVSGNCSMCKKHIEKAATTGGVTKAIWSQDTKKLTLTYNAAKISSDQVQQKIAAAGYDTEKYRGDDKAYSALDECCQYDRKKTNTKTSNHQ
ncbi:MAG: Co/Zn/Cd efflux system rane fusion protein [Chitinophagaceae bacterium]|nr:Co/Zn/Cd efflux system rane fusion protein [Chitinophagaceae bacterium]